MATALIKAADDADDLRAVARDRSQGAPLVPLTNPRQSNDGNVCVK